MLEKDDVKIRQSAVIHVEEWDKDIIAAIKSIYPDFKPEETHSVVLHCACAAPVRGKCSC
jgi:hypothetical protein